MSSAYATQQQLSEYARIQGRGDEVIHDAVLPRVSRLIDQLCGVKPNYFALAPMQATTITMIGSGTSLMRMPHFVPCSILYAEYISDWDFLPQYAEIVDANGIQWLQTEGCFQRKLIEFTARWGWASIPEDIVEATIELAMATWRQSDVAFLRVQADLSGQGGVSGAALPERTKLICAEWKRKRAVVFA